MRFRIFSDYQYLSILLHSEFHNSFGVSTQETALRSMSFPKACLAQRARQRSFLRSRRPGSPSCGPSVAAAPAAGRRAPAMARSLGGERGGGWRKPRGRVGRDGGCCHPLGPCEVSKVLSAELKHEEALTRHAHATVPMLIGGRAAVRICRQATRTVCLAGKTTLYLA